MVSPRRCVGLDRARVRDAVTPCARGSDAETVVRTRTAGGAIDHAAISQCDYRARIHDADPLRCVRIAAFHCAGFARRPFRDRSTAQANNESSTWRLRSSEGFI